MRKLAIVYFSHEGSTEWIARQLRLACVEEAIEPTLIVATEADVDDLLAYDAYAFGSPDYLGYMAGAMKTVFDLLSAFRPVIVGRPFVAFTTYQAEHSTALKSLNELGQAVGLHQAHPGLSWKLGPRAPVADTCVEMIAAILKRLNP